MADLATPSAAAIATSSTEIDTPKPAQSANTKIEKPDETAYQAALTKAKNAFEEAKQTRVSHARLPTGRLIAIHQKQPMNCRSFASSFCHLIKLTVNRTVLKKRSMLLDLVTRTRLLPNNKPSFAKS